MPLNIPANLPAGKTLRDENVFTMSVDRARSQDIRPLEIGIINLMPTKIATETQILRLLANTPLQVEVTFIQMSSHISKNTSREHLEAFYRTYDDIKDKRFDGLIITGAPVERMPFSSVNYWDELCMVMEWSKSHVFSVMHICWGAQAALFYHYGIDKYDLGGKLSGVFPHRVLNPKSRLMRGFDSVFYAPHSRYTSVCEEDLLSAGLSIIAKSDEAGVYIAANSSRRHIFVTGHSEYDMLTLDGEYRRDLSRGIAAAPPVNYYENDNPGNPPLMRWRAHAYLLFSNWLNYYVYQETPYDLGAL